MSEPESFSGSDENYRFPSNRGRTLDPPSNLQSKAMMISCHLCMDQRCVGGKAEIVQMWRDSNKGLSYDSKWTRIVVLGGIQHRAGHRAGGRSRGKGVV